MGKGKKARKLLARLNSQHNPVLLPCPPCMAEEHWACDSVSDPFPHTSISCCCADRLKAIEPIEPIGDITNTPNRTGPVKEAHDITDVQSTGRKRAALMYPLEEGMICEWAKLKSAGGGVVPIIGCLGNPATDRHHGPDKNTLNNTPENVHRICSPCHNLWHARNDEFYGVRPAGTEPFIPLDGFHWVHHDKETLAETDELVRAQLGRKLPKLKEQ